MNGAMGADQGGRQHQHARAGQHRDDRFPAVGAAHQPVVQREIHNQAHNAARGVDQAVIGGGKTELIADIIVE